nr:immunoglobulin heavy chain junction region [Macaca mulatta]MOV38314.1 immunoglobulin heavy chain junction region [Macaca mulatta]MOV38373.1 immunoglobulin heavy chain junction region [Macaca mulatta]MOV38915.1 immunoglobulin heavy chain junction region [Macaca mulatta]MOV39451.1 immunoglobulin heavy chain junction region [Macaca mulatta]
CARDSYGSGFDFW